MTIYLTTYSLLDKYRRCIPILTDSCIAILSYVAPFAITGMGPFKNEIILNTIPIYTTIYIGTFIVLKVCTNMWRYTGIYNLYHCMVSFSCKFLKNGSEMKMISTSGGRK